MKFFAVAASLVAVVSPVMAAMTINTPTSVVQCQPQLLSWTDGTGPYYLTIIPGGQPSASPLKSFEKQNSNSITWIVDVPAGTSITCALKDSTGATAYTDMITVQPSGDNSCLNGGSSPSTGTTGGTDNGNSGNSETSSPTIATQAADVASSGAPRASTSAASGVLRPTSAGNASASAASRAAAGTTTVGTPNATNSAISGAESRANVGSYGIAGVVGLLGAMFL